MQNEIDLPDRLLTAVQVRQFFANVSHMWLARRLQDDPTFPRPIVIANRRYWKLSELRAWIAKRQQDAA